MKQRNGFVSNSSSSSFILAIDKKQKVVKYTFEAEIDSLGTVIHNVKELDKQFCEDYDKKSIKDVLNDEYEGEYAEKRYNQCLEMLNKGKYIIIGTCSNESDDAMEQLIFNYGLETHVDADVVEESQH